MLNSRASIRYAKTLFNAASEEKILENVHNDIKLIMHAYDDNQDLVRFFHHPEIASDKRCAIFEQLFKKRVNPLSFDFLCFLERKDRLNLIRQICNDFNQLYFEHNDIIEVTIVSTKKLDTEQEKEILLKLEQRYKKHVHAKTSIDASLIGGIKIFMKDSILDLSLKNQLNKLRDKMTYA